MYYSNDITFVSMYMYTWKKTTKGKLANTEEVIINQIGTRMAKIGK